MPNIEIHGYDCPIADEPKRIRQMIKGIFRGQPIFGEIATEIVLSSSQDLADNHLPYLRVWDTDEERGRKVANILRLNGFHVERPVILAEYVEPSMWSEKEIAEDLKWILQSDWLKSRISGTLMVGAIENLQSHEYAKVAEFYLLIVRELRTKIGSKGNSSTCEIAELVPLANKKVSRDENDPLARLIMLIQIIFSLMPRWNILTIFPAD